MDADPSSSTSKLEEAAALLAPAHEILEKFNYKHKNQHRLSKWWAGFDMLRRHTAKFSRDEIRPALDASTKRDSMMQSRKKQSKRQRIEPRDEDVTAGAVAKAKWMGDYLIPKAYAAITQLAAENQFAHLGLLLLGVLAQVHSAVSLLLPADSSEQELELEAAAEGKEVDMGVVVPRQEQRGLDRSPPASLAAGVSKPPNDLGEAVARDTFDAREQDLARPKLADDYTGAVGTTAVERKRPPKMDTGKRKKDAVATSGLGEPLAGDQSAKSRSADQEKPKHKTKTARKEMDVEPIEKPKKKKKRKKGDEFDDLFSSLM
ncbi:hypothetical protein PpBr36_00498 [Pyricularia pennisetigena]|uniref:hypothetical protein n=1 Tax=Pyricularia pennisetigena TaxID=1578925 RepID=UPI0011547738|nr:hypothetical protein PpBr36_00498 [Pyricularia pennisetigena]TLS29298.1 hypothetical protein PpBr36_00498 [Pyricularia pennisetigena]